MTGPEPLFEHAADCPYCGEPLQLLVDVSAGSQAYVEDCEVCCQPMEVEVTVDADGEAHVAVERGA